MDWIGGFFQVKKTVDPEIRDLIGKKNICDRGIQNSLIQIYSHDIGYMLNGIATVFQHVVKILGYKWTDLEDCRSSQTLIDLLAVGDFFPPWKGGSSKLFHAVGSVSVKVGKTENPSVIKFHFMGWPCVQ